jgi:site-specific DNA-methyltransferase (adenine-specific)
VILPGGEFTEGRKMPKIELHLGDCLEALKTVPDNSIDIIWTDPPYGNNNNNGDLIARREAALGKRDYKKGADDRPILNDDPDNWERVVCGMLDEAARILRKGRSVICCCCGGGGPRTLFAKTANWIDSRLAFDQAVVWDKGGLGMGWRYRRNYEFVMVAHRKGGKMKWEWADHKKITANVVNINKIIPKKHEHPTPKPPALIEHFLKLHGRPGDTVLDPFMGGGTTGVVAKNLGMNFVGMELDSHWFAYAKDRIESAENPFDFLD